MSGPKRIVTGQKVQRAKLERAKVLRRQMTLPERRLWQRLRANRLGGWHFRRQQVVDGFLLDFYCHQAALVLEVDGAVHAHQEEYDAERSRWLEARGLRVMRVSNAELETEAGLEQVLERIRLACEGNSERPADSPYPPAPSPR